MTIYESDKRWFAKSLERKIPLSPRDGVDTLGMTADSKRGRIFGGLYKALGPDCLDLYGEVNGQYRRHVLVREEITRWEITKYPGLLLLLLGIEKQVLSWEDSNNKKSR